MDHRQPAERAWERLKSAFHFGDCLTTVATSEMSGKTERSSSEVWPLLDPIRARSLVGAELPNPYRDPKLANMETDCLPTVTTRRGDVG